MSRSNFLNNLQYCQYYCEENIWQLCGQSKFAKDAWVLFISNPQNQFAMWEQKVVDPSSPVVWDYHVILLAKEEGVFRIYDFDSRLAFGCDAELYFSNSFIRELIPDELSPQFLIQTASYFRNNFQSNREHMKDPEGLFLKPEPPWEKLSMESNLDRYLRMDSTKDTIFGLDDLREKAWSALTEQCYS